MAKAKINTEFTYKTRDGQEAKDVHFVDVNKDDPYMVCAKVNGYPEYFTERGHYFKDQIHTLDLIKQPVKKTKPVAKPVQKEVMKTAGTPEVIQQDGTSTQHVHHDMIVAWAKNTDLKVEFKSKHDGSWVKDARPDWDDEYEWRFKPEEPKLLTIIGADGKARSYPEPCRVKPSEGQEYSVACPTDTTLSCSVRWWNDKCDIEWFDRGLVHLTKQAAELHAKAMLGID